MHEFPGYRLERELGRGAMAVVYLAMQLSLNRLVALKVLDRNVDGYDELARRFIHEAHTLAGLRHRNIVSVYDVVDSPQGDFISMEYLEGGHLRSRLAGGMDLQASLSILAQLATALDAAHARGIVHRDIKPDNVLFRDADTPVLTDFGIAREIDAGGQRMTREGLVLGTPGYMAPEQISGEAIDGRADQYSLGAMWFEMLTGRVPYSAETTSDLLYAHLARPIPQLPSRLAALQPVLGRMLAKAPAQRYPDLGAMVLDLGRRLLDSPDLLQGPAGSAPVGPIERLHQLGFPTGGMQMPMPSAATVALSSTASRVATPPPPHSSNRRKSIGIAVIGLALLALALLGYFFRQRPQVRAATVPSVASPAARPASNERAGAIGKSIAVLPFANMSSDPDQEYFADGISEELLNQLAQIRELRVIARTSSFSYKGRTVTVAEIARELDVTHVLEGSVRKSGNTIRITAQLVRAADSREMWSQTYDRPIGDIFAVQDEISAAVVGQLRLQLLGAVPKARTIDPKAYALFLQARQLLRQRTATSLAQALALYRQALAIDPGYADAWSGLSQVYTAQTLFLGVLPLEEGSRLAREAALRALALDPGLASAHAVLARLAAVSDGDLAEAGRQYARALALAPDDPDLLRGASELSMTLGRADDAVVLGEAALDRDPMDVLVQVSIGNSYLVAGRPKQAIASFRRALALSPRGTAAHYSIGTALLQMGRPQEALAEMQLEPGELWREVGLAMAWHALGHQAESDAALARLIRDQPRTGPYNIAYVQAYLGHPDLAFEWLEKAVAYHDSGLVEIASAPEFANLRQDPRWLPFLRRIGKAPEQLAAIRLDVGLPRASDAK